MPSTSRPTDFPVGHSGTNQAATALPPQFVAPAPVRRVNVNFSDQAYHTLEELATHSGKSMSEVLREAIALKAWFDHERADGNRILVERPNGQVREVISV